MRAANLDLEFLSRAFCFVLALRVATDGSDRTFAIATELRVDLEMPAQALDRARDASAQRARRWGIAKANKPGAHAGTRGSASGKGNTRSRIDALEAAGQPLMQIRSNSECRDCTRRSSPPAGGRAWPRPSLREIPCS